MNIFEQTYHSWLLLRRDMRIEIYDDDGRQPTTWPTPILLLSVCVCWCVIRSPTMLIRRVSNKLLPSYDVDGSPWSIGQNRTRHLYRYVLINSHAIVSHFSPSITSIQTQSNMRNSSSAAITLDHLFTYKTKALKNNTFSILKIVSSSEHSIDWLN